VFEAEFDRFDDADGAFLLPAGQVARRRQANVAIGPDHRKTGIADADGRVVVPMKNRQGLGGGVGVLYKKRFRRGIAEQKP
ncbi:hypothetical protein, partial [Halalkalibacter lacteus]|uniref:hypothetical protein n=1 Tax=Halalkalibacter lacteus TaxID=3090663 RepID=UPI002FC8B4CC